MIDLHLHLDGSIDAHTLIHLADLSGLTLPTKNTEKLGKMLSVSENCSSLSEYLEKFDLPLYVLQTRKALTFAVFELIKKLSAQGLCYAEIRFAPQKHTQSGLTQTEAVQAAAEGLIKAKSQFDMNAQLILCCMRGNGNSKDNEETVKTAARFLNAGVCAVDLAGDESKYPTEQFCRLFQMAQEYNIPFTVHAGEASGAQSVFQALKAGAARIGHGINSVTDTALLNELQSRNIYLEMCYSSNLQTKAVALGQNYPIRTFLEHNIPVTVNTDNMSVSNTTLKKEYLKIKNNFGLSDETLYNIALNAADGAFLTSAEKRILKAKIKKNFFLWIAGK